LHLEFHNRDDGKSASVWLTALLDQSTGQQNSGLFIALTVSSEECRHQLCSADSDLCR